MLSAVSWRYQAVSVAGLVVLLALAAGPGDAQGPARRPGPMHGGGQPMHGGGQPMHGGGQPMGGMGQHQGMMGGMGQQRMQGMAPAGQPGVQPGQGMGPMQGMMGDAAMQNLPEPMRMRMRMMLDMQVDQNDPAGLLALKDELGLTRDQILALNKILADARKQAAALITAPQRKRLHGLANTPDTAREMQRHMMQGMQPNQAMQGGPGARQMQGPMQGGPGAQRMQGPMQGGPGPAGRQGR